MKEVLDKLPEGVFVQSIEDHHIETRFVNNEMKALFPLLENSLISITSANLDREEMESQNILMRTLEENID